MKNYILDPKIIFGTALFQVIFVYAYWTVYGLSGTYDYDINYIPLLTWLVGYMFFCIGDVIGNRMVKKTLPLQAINVDYDLRLIGFLVLVQFILAIISYGGIPIYRMVFGSQEISEVSNMQTTAAFGQIGLFAITLTVCSQLLSFKVAGEAPLGIIGHIVLWMTVFGTLMSGKRQGFFTLCFFLFIAAIMRKDAPIRNVIKKITGLGGNLAYRIIVITFIVLVIGSFGLVENVRSKADDHKFGLEAIIRYLEMPFLNYMHQTELIGQGPQEFHAWMPFQGLIPVKISESMNLPVPFRIEPSSPSGIWEYTTWFWGPYGNIIFSFSIGLLTRVVYNKSWSSNMWLGIYLNMAWAMFTAISYNHFLTLNYMLMPSVLIVVLEYMGRITFKAKLPAI